MALSWNMGCRRASHKRVFRSAYGSQVFSSAPASALATSADNLPLEEQAEIDSVNGVPVNALLSSFFFLFLVHFVFVSMLLGFGLIGAR